MKTKIAIDGPAGAGKSTVARAVAKRLGLAYLDTGAMYRAVTLAALRNKVNLLDNDALGMLTGSVQIEIQSNEAGENILFLNGENVSTAIREPEINRNVSFIARSPDVREIMVQKQKEIGSRGNVVMDGRDIGTNVMPDAECKIYLTASLEERARRRLAELISTGETLDLDQMIAEIAARDKIDSERECSPLCPAHDAIHVDTTNMDVYQVIDIIVGIATAS